MPKAKAKESDESQDQALGSAEEVAVAPSEETQGVPCKVCSTNETVRYHRKTFDGPGVGHWPFDPNSDANRQFEFYCAEPLVKLFIPLQQGEKLGALATPQVNGLKTGIVKGMYVDVPQSLGQIVMDSLNQTARLPSEATTVNPYTGETRLANLDLRSEQDRQALS